MYMKKFEKEKVVTPNPFYAEVGKRLRISRISLTIHKNRWLKY